MTIFFGTVKNDKAVNSRITNEKELYNAVCREATIYEENADLMRMAESLLAEIEQRLCVGTFKEKIDYESYFQVLQIFYENWEDINWKDTAEFELKEKVKSFLNIYKTTKAFQIEDAVNVLSAVINAADGIYPIILVNALEACKNEKSYYDLLVFVQNNWNYIPWDFEEEEDERIRFFTGKYEFLSNVYEEEFIHDGITYQNAEAAYQASKTEYEPLKRMFSTLNAHDAKKTGRQIVLREKWHSETEMYNVLWDKFHQSPELASLLKNTKDAMIAPEGIGTFWGVKDGKGENHLGKILMEIRDTLPENDTNESLDEKQSKEDTSNTEGDPACSLLNKLTHSVTDYENGVINVERMINALTSLAKSLEGGGHAVLIADLSEVLEDSENVPKSLYSLIKKYISSWNDLKFQ